MLEFLLFLTGQAAGRNTALVFLSGWSTAHYRPDVEDAAGRINWAQLQRISKFGALHMLLLHMATTGCLRYNYVTLYSPLEINPLPSTTAHVHTRLVPLCTEDRTAARAVQIGDR